MYATVIREIPAYMVQFGVYEYLKREIFYPGAILGPPKSNTFHLGE